MVNLSFPGFLVNCHCNLVNVYYLASNYVVVFSIRFLSDYNLKLEVQPLQYLLAFFVHSSHGVPTRLLLLSHNHDNMSHLDLYDLRAKYTRFRILVIGRANAGKTTLLQRVCNTTEDPCIYDENNKNLVGCS